MFFLFHPSAIDTGNSGNPDHSGTKFTTGADTYRCVYTFSTQVLRASTGIWQQHLLLNLRKQQQQFRRSVAKGYRLDMMLL